MQYNKGNINFGNHLHNLQHIVQTHSPHIMCISEANIKKVHFDSNANYIPGYNILLNKQYDQIGVSRNCMLVKEGINFNRRGDLEDSINCDIWVQISTGSNKNTLICGSYRQWSLLKEMGVKDSKNIKQQEFRYQKSIDNWQKAMNENRDTIFVTDDNLDSNLNSELNK